MKKPTASVDKLVKQYGYWGTYQSYPAADWVYEVRNGDTRRGYWEWVAAKLEEESNLQTLRVQELLRLKGVDDGSVQ